MRLIVTFGYYTFLFPEDVKVGELIDALQGAKPVDYCYSEKVYKETETEIKLEFVKDAVVVGLPEKDKLYLEDISKANDRASGYLKEKEKLEKELKELKEKFAPFLSKEETTEE